jgi:hypothetical protein
MTCQEFERVLPQLGDGSSLDREAHLRSCAACSILVDDLRAISTLAPVLRDLEEPSDQIWNAIEISLRNEGLIRERVPLRLPAMVEHTIEDESHVLSCPDCAHVLADMEAISMQARLLQGSEEPSPRVWNSIEIALRNEGLIRPLPTGPGPRARWKLAWLVPVAAAALAFVATIVLRHDGSRQQIADSAPVVVTLAQSAAGSPAEEEQFMTMVEDRGPALRAAYKEDLKAVNSFIREAEESVHANPQDEIAQQYLRNAYEQKAMIYEMAMNRPLQ